MLDLFFRLLLNILDAFMGRANVYGNPDRPIVYLDCETTGLTPYASTSIESVGTAFGSTPAMVRPHCHELLSLAAIVEIRGRVTYTLDSLVRPERIEQASERALEMNDWDYGLRWKDAPTKYSVCEELAVLLRPTVDANGRKLYPTVVAHNAAFDMEMLRAMWAESMTPPFPRIHRVMDTLAMSEGVIGSVGWSNKTIGHRCVSFTSNSMDNIRRHM